MFSNISSIFNIFENPIKKINFEDVNYAITHTNKYIIINTLPANEQDCLIKNTISIEQEERVINDIIDDYSTSDKNIIIYGRNTSDFNAEKKYKQLLKHGFKNVFLYPGGMFEWLLLQDIYGDDQFPTTKKMMDILKYKPNRALNISLIKYID